MVQESLRATVVRGGTSKGIYFEERDLPDRREEWDDLLLNAYGSPDPMQIDGIGGSHSTTSKTMICSPGEGTVDVEYTFGQVGVEKPVVDWGGNCGNLSFAIGPFALERGIVSVDGDADRATIRLRNTNTGTVVEQAVPVDEDGAPRYEGDFKVYGVPGTGGRITSRFLDPGGSVTDALFPTGERTETLDIEGIGDIEASIVDVSSPCVFVRASDVGMTATELPEEINAEADLLDRLERIRSAATERCGFVDDRADATDESPGIPKMAVVGERRAYETVSGERLETDDYDLLARIMSMQKAHHAYAVTGAMCTAAASALDGTIPAEFGPGRDGEITIGHPKGPMTVGVEVTDDHVDATTVDRTARQIMDGNLFYLSD
jgi:2-methylaconitate cis-trans-isomerase PrpF